MESHYVTLLTLFSAFVMGSPKTDKHEEDAGDKVKSHVELTVCAIVVAALIFCVLLCVKCFIEEWRQTKKLCLGRRRYTRGERDGGQVFFTNNAEGSSPIDLNQPPAYTEYYDPPKYEDVVK